jgi:hypothetical protein
MEPQDNRQLALQKAISSHEQAAAGLADLKSSLSEAKHTAMLDRIQQNIAELHAEAEGSRPDDLV